MTQFHGKAIYHPSGKAGEYSYWACNLFNGCSAKCNYCYNRRGRAAKVLGGDSPTLKKCLIDEDTAFDIFSNEMFSNEIELRKHGLLFNFVSDPFLPETSFLNLRCMRLCVWNDIPVKALTKQTWWINHFLNFLDLEEECHTWNKKHLFAFGFTLTGHDELEPGAATNVDRIRSMDVLSREGFKTWASIEPIIDFESSFKMIVGTHGICDLYKIGLESGKKYDKNLALTFLSNVILVAGGNGSKIYFKDSILKLLGISRESLNKYDCCVNSDYNLFEN